MNDLEQTTCKMCGRKLRSNESIIRGMGDKCWKKFLSQNNKQLFSLGGSFDDTHIHNNRKEPDDK